MNDNLFFSVCKGKAERFLEENRLPLFFYSHFVRLRRDTVIVRVYIFFGISVENLNLRIMSCMNVK